MKTVLLEYYPLRITNQQLMEGHNPRTGTIFVETILQRAEQKNQNGRIYPKKILLREVENYIKGPIAENRALGELDHAESNVINLKNACLNIKKVWWEGEDVKGVVEILNTPSGRILQELLKSGVTVGISSRGVGSVEQIDENTAIVGEDFALLCWDAVSTPSTHRAFMQPISLKEGVEEIPIMSGKYGPVNEIIKDMICLKSGFTQVQDDK